MTTIPCDELDLIATGDVLRLGDIAFSGASSYADAIEWLTRQALEHGRPVRVHSMDLVSGREGWFAVDADGTIQASAPTGLSAVVDASTRRADVRFVKTTKPRPRTGLRGAVYAATRGAVNLGQSALERETDELARRISRKLTGSHSTAILSLKGGVGKTSTTGGVGMMLAEHRGDPPCAVDMNPDSGDLAERVVGEAAYDVETAPTVTDVVREAETIGSLTELAGYMHHANRLHVIAGEQDPEVSDALTADDHARVQALVARYYSVVLTDCGTGVSHPAMAGILRSVSNVVIVTDWAVSAADRVARAIGWLREHGYAHLADGAIVVVTDMADVPDEVDRSAIARFLEVSSAQLIQIPRDRAAAGGVQIVPERVSPATRLAWMRIAAAIVDRYR
ncbi:MULTISPECIES: MinD/ParA family ATP-binding protein [Clavibacter]|uniref:MinD/ParA family protein n=2 Tax=Clavibacter TaxID=1573 RepID=A0A399NY62_9MICO|nr:MULTISPECIES: MinD/ParA family protein [Clavibacter]KDP89791.1 hypothetical protein W824_14960 [Clavibacter cf. michiganensis LMG 26808]RII99070.1 MinD/ParA family protein [Clavibacter michiganensis]UKF26687.1 MinD/ParA family protein [Clavibacter sp. A6099]